MSERNIIVTEMLIGYLQHTPQPGTGIEPATQDLPLTGGSDLRFMAML